MNIPLEGYHHSGLDDSRNIAKIVAALLKEGCKFEITATIESTMSLLYITNL
jgi:inhibitor of KinA sporulation pathway (predicted exonuclease)